MTRFPIFELEKVVGTAEAWAMINEAHRNWEASDTSWITWYERDDA